MIWTDESKLRIWNNLCGTQAYDLSKKLIAFSNEGTTESIKFVSVASSCFYFSADGKMKVGIKSK